MIYSCDVGGGTASLACFRVCGGSREHTLQTAGPIIEGGGGAAYETRRLQSPGVCLIRLRALAAWKMVWCTLIHFMAIQVTRLGIIIDVDVRLLLCARLQALQSIPCHVCVFVGLHVAVILPDSQLMLVVVILPPQCVELVHVCCSLL